jgi:hypothetical protein
MQTKLFLLLMLSGCILSCVNSKKHQVSCELTAEEKKAVSKEIETVVRNFMDAKTLSYETHTGLRANTEGYVMGGEGKIRFTSYDDYEKYMKASFARIQKFTEFEILSMYIYVLARDAATCTTLFKSKFLRTSGDTIVNNGCWTMVFKKFNNEWKVVQENGTHTN